MTKLVWSMFTRPDEMWAKVIMTKYLKKVKRMLCSRGSSRMLNVCRVVKQEWDTMTLGLKWNIQNGQGMSFWNERWVDSGVKLRDFSIGTHDWLDSVALWVTVTK
ncbi:hypothetical protein LINPERHAP1_LOCUS36498 [Linum perenne]